MAEINLHALIRESALTPVERLLVLWFVAEKVSFLDADQIGMQLGVSTDEIQSAIGYLCEARVLACSNYERLGVGISLNPWQEWRIRQRTA